MRNTKLDEALLAAAVDVETVESRLADGALAEEDQDSAEYLAARSRIGVSGKREYAIILY